MSSAAIQIGLDLFLVSIRGVAMTKILMTQIQEIPHQWGVLSLSLSLIWPEGGMIKCVLLYSRNTFSFQHTAIWSSYRKHSPKHTSLHYFTSTEEMICNIWLSLDTKITCLDSGNIAWFQKGPNSDPLGGSHVCDHSLHFSFCKVSCTIFCSCCIKLTLKASQCRWSRILYVLLTPRATFCIWRRWQECCQIDKTKAQSQKERLSWSTEYDEFSNYHDYITAKITNNERLNYKGFICSNSYYFLLSNANN